MITFMKMMSLSREEGLSGLNGIEASSNIENDSWQQVPVRFVKIQCVHLQKPLCVLWRAKLDARGLGLGQGR